MTTVANLRDGDEFSLDGGETWHVCSVVLFGSVAVYTDLRRDDDAPLVRIDAERDAEVILRRTYVVGLPVIVAITDDGFVEVEVDLSELAREVSRYDDLHMVDDEQASADADVLSEWVDGHEVRNEGYVR